MSKIKLKNIFLGYNDGKNEAIYKNDFEKYFFDYNCIYENLKSKPIFLILGRKGSGKTILAEYYKKKETSYSHGCEIFSFKDFRFHEIISLKSDDIRPNEYILFWEWVILIHYAKLLLRDESVQDVDSKIKLKKFFEHNYNSLDIETLNIVDETKKIKIGFPVLGIEYEKGPKTCKHNYLNYIDDLRRIIMRLISSSSRKYTIFYDELDDRFRDDEIYKNSIVSLIKAARKVNLNFIETRIDAKIILILRSDIFYILNDADLNKIKVDNSISIDWGNKADNTSPLISMILIKVKKSIPALNDIPDDDLYKIIFPQDINLIEPSRFLLGRTFFRPRDVITYLNLIIDKYKETEYFGWKGFVELLPDYSEYFFLEIRNELSGHLSDTEIDQGTLLIKQFNKFEFSYEEIKTYFDKNKSIFDKIDLEKILRIFFKFSIVGNKWYNAQNQKDYFRWSYRDNKAELNFDNKIVLHLGLRVELSN